MIAHQHEEGQYSITALYCRLSSDDGRVGDSNSIINQKAISQNYAHNNGFINTRFYIDDGYSGVHFKRPGFTAMIDDVKAGCVSTVIVKDLSRFGRNYLDVGGYIDVLFPSMDVRFIAINDGVDTLYGDNDLTPIRNVINEWVSRDTSRKIRAVNHARVQAGERLSTNPPYGYKKNPKNPKEWLVDEAAAKVVKMIFELCMKGLGPSQIARQLREEKILVPIIHFARSGRNVGTALPKQKYSWDASTIADILAKPEYLGHTVNHKTYTKSYKDTKTRKNSPENWVVIENTHEPIVDAEVFAIAQRLRQFKRRPTKMGEMPALCGLIFCADCGRRLYFCRGTTLEKSQENFVCAGVRKNPPVCTTHYIRYITLEEKIKEDLHSIYDWIRRDKDGFIQTVLSSEVKQRTEQMLLDNAQLESLQNRIIQLDKIIKQLYEDSVEGKIQNGRFLTLLEDFELEQAELQKQVLTLSQKLNAKKMEEIDTNRFMELMYKHFPFPVLEANMLRELIEKISVHAPDKSTGKRLQKVDIYYNYGIGDLQSKLPYHTL